MQFKELFYLMDEEQRFDWIDNNGLQLKILWFNKLPVGLNIIRLISFWSINACLPVVWVKKGIIYNGEVYRRIYISPILTNTLIYVP